MTSSLKPFLLLSALLSCTAVSASATTSDGHQPPAAIPAEACIPLAETAFSAGEAVAFSDNALFSLQAAEGMLIRDVSFTATAITGSPSGSKSQINDSRSQITFPSLMHGVTRDMHALRLLPSGTHFRSPARLELAYDPALLPTGTTAEDIYTFWYDSTSFHWQRLERLEVDTVRHLVASLTDHFTDFANAVISVPELPQTEAFVPTMMTDLPDPDPLEGIPMVTVDGLSSFGSPTGDNSGSASLTYPIVLPAGRHGLQPDVSLRYNSDGGNGVLGVGWSMVASAVTIDTRWGVPRYDIFRETEAYLVNGEPVAMYDTNTDAALPLPHQDTAFQRRDFQTKMFVFRDRRNASRVIRHGQTPATYWWEVNTTSGITYYYGRTFDPEHPDMAHIDENSVLRADSSIGYWALTAVVDMNGNYVKYYNNNTGYCPGFSCQHPDGDNIYTERIEYTGNCNTGTSPAYAVDFTWNVGRDDAFTDARLGFMRKTDRRLCQLGVMYHDTAITRYYMSYSCADSTMWKTRLDAIVKADSTGVYSHDCNWLEVALNNNRHLPGSRTVFRYNNAPQSMFGPVMQMEASASNNEINKSISGGFNVGGTATVGLGFNVFETSATAGGHYTFGMNFGKMKSMLLDMNGDGLPDLVYNNGNNVYYKRQNLNQGFSEPVEIPGLTRLSRDISRTHDWGLQLSIGGCLNFSNPITLSYTDWYFTDINADGLPDMVTPDGVLFNHLDNNGNPSFSLYVGGSVTVPQQNSECGGIVFTGKVDNRLECHLELDFVDSQSLDDVIPNDTGISGMDNDTSAFRFFEESGVFTTNSWNPLPSYHGGRLIESPFSEDTPSAQQVQTAIADKNNTVQTDPAGRTTDIRADFFEDGYIYRVIDGRIHKYIVHEVCPNDTTDPLIETVRVWVAPDTGYVSGMSGQVRLLQDTTVSRAQSRKADGVRCVIQLNRNNQRTGTRFSSTTAVILDTINIDNNDYSVHTFSESFSVSKGDIVSFRLVSKNNSLYDNVDWNISIPFNAQEGSLTTYNSATDYICTGNRRFAAPDTGQAIIRYKYQNSSMSNVTLSFNGSSKSGIVLYAGSSSNDNYISFDTLNLYPDDSIAPVITYTGLEPVWSGVHIFPEIEFRGRYFNSDSSVIVADTAFFYPDMKYPCSVISIDSIYTILFGPLHKGWGRFAYNNRTGSDTLDLRSIVNTEHLARQVALQQEGGEWNVELPLPDNVDQAAIDSLDVDDVTSVFAANELYNPLNDTSCWVSMQPDSRTERWMSYGNMGYISKTGQSNKRTIEKPDIPLGIATTDTENDIPYYDSAIPVAEDGVGGKNKFIRKSSKTIGFNISGGVPVMNHSVSWGTYSVVTDFIDLNGDGYPDPVGPSGVQYTTPWGGLGMLIPVEMEQTESKNNGYGVNFSGTAAMMNKMPGNSVSKSPFSIDGANGGINMNTGFSKTTRSFADINGDGLPDVVRIIRQDSATVSYNLGYSFADPVPVTFSGIKLNSGYSLSFGADNLPPSVMELYSQTIPNVNFSIEQYSISGGSGGSVNVNLSDAMLTDINGDGLPDIVKKDNTGLVVAYNRGTFFSTWDTIPDIFNLQQSYSLSVEAHAAVSIGFTILGAKIVAGMNLSGNYSESRTDTTFIDMNGDGYPDHVTYSSGSINVRYNQACGTNLLTGVVNPTGHDIGLWYMLSTPDAAHRSRKWYLKYVEDSDSRNPWNERRNVVTGRHYGNQLYDTHERTDYGYAEVITDEGNRLITEHYVNTDYNNRNRKTGDLLHNGAKPLIGHRYACGYMDADGHNTGNTCGPDIFVMAEETHTDYYEGASAPQVTSAVRTEYDRHYNMVHYVDSGDVALTGDEWQRKVTYLDTDYKNLVSLPVNDSVTDMGGTLLRHRLASWTTSGRLKQAVVHDPQTNMQALTSLKYDNYGNVCWYALPKNDSCQRVNYQILYDTALHTYPSEMLNQFGERKYIYYDPRFGKPVIAVDAAGYETAYTYDRLGRLTHVLAPAEQAAVQQGWWYLPGIQPFTIKYDYLNIRHDLYVNAVDSLIHTCVVKQMWSDHDHHIDTAAVIYSARGEVLQHKNVTEVDGHIRYVTDGIHVQDALGRIVYTHYPSVSDSALCVYDGVSNSTGATGSRIFYDILDRDTLVVLPDGAEIHKRYGFACDTFGLLRLASWQTDPLGNTTLMLSSPQQHHIQTTMADGNITFYDYNCIGELEVVEDADGYKTFYEYDRFGRRTQRIHPDAGTTVWDYDPAGNIVRVTTQKQHDAGDRTLYHYCFDRLMCELHQQRPWESVRYNYDDAGRPAYREDITGSERIWYDPLGNVSQTLRRIILPSEPVAFPFMTRYYYDSFGRTRRITYPDGEDVYYYYHEGGNLFGFYGSSVSLDSLFHNEFGQVTRKYYGNGCFSEYAYNTDRQWCNRMVSGKENGHNDIIFQDLNYTYNLSGDITGIEQTASDWNSMGGWYIDYYFYDNRHRLVQNLHSDNYIGGTYHEFAYSGTTRIGSKVNDNPVLWAPDLLYGYDNTHLTHQPRVVYDRHQEAGVQLYWDGNGNLEQVQSAKGESRYHLWDDSNRMLMSLGPKLCGYYGNSAAGDRPYKITGLCMIDAVNGGEIDLSVFFDNAILYPNRLMTLDPKGYTKHYFAGTERIATAIGGGGNNWLVTPYDQLTEKEETLSETLQGKYLYNDYYYQESDDGGVNNTDIYDTDPNLVPELQYDDPPVTIRSLTVNFDKSISSGLAEYYAANEPDEVFYHHPDHLGSASWITNADGYPVQYLMYAPYGEQILNQQPIWYDERFTFTGKERDAETGYFHIEARKYFDLLGIWISTDPLLDKFIYNSSYVYCEGNPIKYKDPNGKIAETAWDIVNVMLDVNSLASNIQEGNVTEAVIDGVGLVLDVTSAVLPGVPAFAGAALKAYRAADKVSDASKLGKAIDKVATATKNTYRQALQKATGKMGKGYEAHHTLPQKYRNRFEKLGINIDDPEHVVWRKSEGHRAKSAEHTKAWNKFFANPANNNCTKEQVLQQRDIIENQVWPDAPKGETPIN